MPSWGVVAPFLALLLVLRKFLISPCDSVSWSSNWPNRACHTCRPGTLTSNWCSRSTFMWEKRGHLASLISPFFVGCFFYYNLSILRGWKTDHPMTKLEFMSLLIYTSTLVYKCLSMYDYFEESGYFTKHSIFHHFQGTDRMETSVVKNCTEVSADFFSWLWR